MGSCHDQRCIYHHRRRRREGGMALLETIIFFSAVTLFWIAGRAFADRWTGAHQAHRAVHGALFEAAYEQPATGGGRLQSGHTLEIAGPTSATWRLPTSEMQPSLIDDRLANQRGERLTVRGRALSGAAPGELRAPDEDFTLPEASVIAPPLAGRRELPWRTLAHYDREVAAYTLRFGNLLSW